MTNEEIYEKETGFLSIKGPTMIRDAAFRAMDEARKDEMVMFVKFLKNYDKVNTDVGILWKVDNPRLYTSEQLYELFKQQEK